MPLASGTRIGSYEIVSAIGAGGMGEVYRARDTKLGRDIALKILPAAFASDPDRLARFRREAQVLASLNHPNIAHVHGFEEAGSGQADVHALVMELVEGEDLSARIARGPMPLDEALPIARQIAEALEAAHEHGIIHRDLKPANVKVTDDGTVKVLDFGLAKALDPSGTSRSNAAESPTLTARATELGIILGTAAYMAPEQAKGKPVDRRADVWAFGAVVYEMLTGRRAFEGTDVTETLAAVIKDAPAFDALPSNVPAPVRRLLRRCLEKDRAKRLDSIGAARLEILDALDPVHRETASASPASPPPAASRRSSLLPWLLATASLVIAAAAIVFAVVNRRPPSDAPLQRFEIATAPTDDSVSIALSPDGRQLVYAAKGAQGSQLWLRLLDQTAAKALADTEGASFPFWAPDGRAIGFFAGGKLKRLDLNGGRPTELAAAASGRGATWSTDDVILFAPTTQSGILRVSASGGTPAQVTKPGGDLGGSLRWPQFLPDNRHFLFFSYQGGENTKGVYVGTLDGTAPKRLMVADSAAVFCPPNWLLMSRDNALVAWRFDSGRNTIDGDPITIAQDVGDAGVYRGAFSASSTGILVHRTGRQQRQLTWIDRAGKVLGTLGAPDNASLSSPELSPNGQRVAVYREVRGDNDVYLIDTNRALMSRFTFDPGSDSQPAWSHDGSQIFFSSGRNGPYNLFIKPSNAATDEHVILTTPVMKWVTSVSRDGEYVLYRALDPTTNLDIWALPLKGKDTKPFPVLQTSFDETEAQFSPNDQWIAYVSNESGGRPEVFVRPFKSGGGKFQISNGGGTQVRWRNDGKEVFYIAPDGRLIATPVTMRPDGQVEIGTPAPLFTTHLASGSNITGVKPQYAVTADGRFLMSVALESATAPPITIEINWEPGKKD